MVIMRAIWFISQIALFGLIASRMINIPTGTIATGTLNLQPNQNYNFTFNATTGMPTLLLDISSQHGLGDTSILAPNGTLVAEGSFNASEKVETLSFNITEPNPGTWTTNVIAGSKADSFTLTAYTSQLDYFRYYVAGLSIMTLYSAAIFIGFDIYEEAEHGVFEYLLSLPVSRRQLVLGRSIGGGLRSFIYVGPLIAVSLYVIGAINPLSFLVSMMALFLFSFGVAGMSITLAVMIKSSDRFDILMGVLDALIVRLSTAMYPLSVVQSSSPIYGSIASFNPVTFVVDLFRWGTNVISLDNPLLPILGVVAFFSIFTFFGVILYEKRIEGGGWQ